MRWEGRERSTNVEDRRNISGKAMVGGGGVLAVIVAIVFTLLNGGNMQQAVQQGAQQLQQQAAQAAIGEQEEIDPNDPQRVFVEVVLKDTEDVWNKLFPELVGKAYQEPKLVLFRNSEQTACGSASSAIGPFYCPGDNKVYLDLSFFDEMRTKFDAPGDFACAYVIAHEVGHHVQNLLGLSQEVQNLQQTANSKVEANHLSVRLELQADFLAGVWAHHAQKAKQILEVDDIGEAIHAAQAIGDDTLMNKAQGRVVPDAFTHGSSEQRIRWFSYGLRTGNLEDLQLLFDTDYEKL